MSFSDLLKENGVDMNNLQLVGLLQTFYQTGYMQGVHDKNPNYDYSLKYKAVVERLLGQFSRTINPDSLAKLEKSLDAMDKYDKDHTYLL